MTKAIVGLPPEFPVDLDGVGELHAAFFDESRTRGRWWHPVAGNPGRPSFSATYAGANVGTRPISYSPAKTQTGLSSNSDLGKTADLSTTLRSGRDDKFVTRGL